MTTALRRFATALAAFGFVVLATAYTGAVNWTQP